MKRMLSIIVISVLLVFGSCEHEGEILNPHPPTPEINLPTNQQAYSMSIRFVLDAFPELQYPYYFPDLSELHIHKPIDYVWEITGYCIQYFEDGTRQHFVWSATLEWLGGPPEDITEWLAIRVGLVPRIRW